jgi:flagellar hook-associated protein 2
VISGVTLNLTLPNSTAQIQVGTDPKAVTDSVNGFISAYNSFITLTNKLTSYDSTANSTSVLTGDSATRNMVGSLQSILGSQWSTTGTGPSYLAQIGVSVNTDGTLALDSTKFQAALSANASGVAAMFTTATGTGAAQGFAVQMANAVQQIEGSNGALGSAQANLQAQVVYMNNQQASMQASLAQTQAALTQEYSALNAEISAAQAQQASLTNQLASLPG